MKSVHISKTTLNEPIKPTRIKVLFWKWISENYRSVDCVIQISKSKVYTNEHLPLLGVSASGSICQTKKVTTSECGDLSHFPHTRAKSQTLETLAKQQLLTDLLVCLDYVILLKPVNPLQNNHLIWLMMMHEVKFV